MKNLAQEQERLEKSRRSEHLMSVGVPLMHQGASPSDKVARAIRWFVKHKVLAHDSLCFIVSKFPEDSYVAGSYMAETATDSRITAAEIGFRSLLRMRKASFERGAEAKSILRNVFTYPDIVIVVNISVPTMKDWCDIRDVEWLGSVIHKRVLNKQKTVFCITPQFSEDKLDKLLGEANATAVSNAFVIDMEHVKK